MKTKLFLLTLLAFFSLKMQAQFICNASFTATPNSNNTVTLVANVGNNSSISYYSWSLGNGTSGYGQNYTATYNAAGTYMICLYVVDTVNNCSDSTCQSVTISNSTPCTGMPTAGTTTASTVSPPNGGIVTFGLNGTSTGTGIIYQWQRAISSSGPYYNITGAVNSTFAEAIYSTYCYRCYIACTNSGLTDTSIGICVTPTTFLPCNAAFSSTSNANGSYTFTTTSTNNSTCTYNWTYGNVWSFGSNSISYTFTSNGTYNVCLLVQDTVNNCSDSSCQTITVTNVSNCNASFTATLNSNNTVSLTYTGTPANPTNISWYSSANPSTPFSTSLNPVYTDTSGIYTISCVINSSPCYDSTTQVVTIPPVSNPCQASFYYYPDTNGAPHTYIGVNTSTNNLSSYVWTWGDGTSTTGQYPSHTYASAGNYMICLYISNPNTNCNDSVCVNATINKTATMYTINFANPTNVKNVSTEIATISPNPATNSFVIKGNADEKYKIEVMNMNGSKIKTMSANANQTIDISTLANTIYLLKITDQNGQTQFSKLIKE